MSYQNDFLFGLLTVIPFMFAGIAWLCLVSFGIFVMVFWILMLIDISKREFPKTDDRTMWLLIVVLTGWLGGLIYYFTVKHPADQARK